MGLRKHNGIIRNNRIMLFFFAYAVLYSVVFVNRFVPWEVDDYAIYSFYAVDFSYGFATKLLPGAIFNLLFGKHAARGAATLFVTVLMLLFFAGLAYLLQRFLRRMPDGRRGAAFLLAVLFLSGGYTFAVYTRTLGLLDTFWILFALLFFFFMEHRALRFLIPLLFVASVLVHNGAMISYIILMSVVLLFRASVSENAKDRRRFLVLLLLSDCAALAVFVFFALKEKSLVCPIEEFHEKLLDHGSDCFYYYDYAFFDLYNGDRYVPDSVYAVSSPLLRAVYVLYYRFRLNVNVLLQREAIHPISLCCGILLLLPMLCFLFRFHGARLRQKGNGLRRFCALLMILQFPVTFFPALLVSEDITRWLSHAFLIAFACLLTVLYYDKDQRELFYSRFSRLLGLTWVRIYLLAYASVSLYTVY